MSQMERLDNYNLFTFLALLANANLCDPRLAFSAPYVITIRSPYFGIVLI